MIGSSASETQRVSTPAISAKPPPISAMMVR